MVGFDSPVPRSAMAVQVGCSHEFSSFFVRPIASWPISEHRPVRFEYAQLAPSLLFVALLWYLVGRWFDRKWVGTDGSSGGKKPRWTVLFLFTLLCAGGASIDIESTSDYLLSGAVIWMAIGLFS
jgi:hypothetical protein